MPKRQRKHAPSPWRQLRANHLLTYPECRICELVDASNHVHHLRYRGVRGVDERSGDLVTLCEDHHNAFHRELGRTGVSVDRGLAWIAARRRPSTSDHLLSILMGSADG